MDHTALVARIDARMRELGLTPKSLARAAGLAETYVRDLREGRSTNPRASHLLKLATALGVSLGELVEGEPRGMGEAAASLAAPRLADRAQEDDRFAQVAAAVDAMLREEFAPHDTATVAKMSRIVWREILALPAHLPFEDRLNFTLSERRSKVRRAREEMF
jgi:transcriptional regulator with XRE-family HTH domain